MYGRLFLAGIRTVTDEWYDEQITGVLVNILDFRTRSNASDTREIKSDPRDGPKNSGAAAEAGVIACESSVVEAEVTAGDAGGEDGLGKRNREVQGEGILGSEGS